MKAFGPFGEVTLNNVSNGIAYNTKPTCNGFESTAGITLKAAFRDYNEMIETASQRGHKITGFVASENGGDYYVAA